VVDRGTLAHVSAASCLAVLGLNRNRDTKKRYTAVLLIRKVYAAAWVDGSVIDPLTTCKEDKWSWWSLLIPGEQELAGLVGEDTRSLSGVQITDTNRCW